MAVVAYTPQIEIQFLKELYDSTDGESWGNYCGYGWNFDVDENGYYIHDPCVESWYNLDCNASSTEAPELCQVELCMLTAVRLSDCNLQGTIPNTISNLTILGMVDMSYNFLYGTIPVTLEPLDKLYNIILAVNALTGSIPLLSASSLLTLDLGVNALSGTLPSILGNYHNLISLVLKDNFLEGTVPPTLGGLTQLRSFSVGFNLLNGSLPTFFSDLNLLSSLDLSSNFFTGSLVHELFESSSLSSLTVSDNLLTGIFPSDIKQSALTTLKIDLNSIGGLLPSGIKNLSSLRNLAMSFNSFSGPLPDELFEMTDIRTLSLSHNLFSGTLSPNVFGITGLTFLDLSYNNFDGLLDVSLISPHQTMEIYLQNNALSGPVPFEFANNVITLNLSSNCFSALTSSSFTGCQFLVNLDVSKNLISTTLPESMFGKDSFLLLDLSSNAIKGTISPSLFANYSYNGNFGLYSISYVYLHENQFTGSIPLEIGNCVDLAEFFVHNNMLTGQIPSTINKLVFLVALLIQGNKFTGKPGAPFISQIVNPYPYYSPGPSLTMLQIVDISQNEFTGTIPKEFFRLPSIGYFASIDSCYSGDIPVEICSSNTLQYLILEGLRSGKRCQIDVWNPFGKSVSYLSGNSIGSVPECLWEMYKLRVLHLSGNMILGTIPGLNNMTNLVDLTLAYNRFSGTLPSGFSVYPKTIVDLSHNRLTGTCSALDNSFNIDSDNVQLKLTINRLSGRIPSSFNRIKAIDILIGNIFGCNGLNDLPEHDDERTKYTCGSDDYDVTLWMAFALVVVLVIGTLTIVMLRKSSELIATYYQSFVGYWKSSTEWSHEGKDRLRFSEIYMFIISVKFTQWISLVTLFLLPIFLLFYVQGKDRSNYSTHTYQYRWLYSVAYFSGEAPAIILLSLYFAVLVLYIVVEHKYLKKKSNKVASEDLNNKFGLRQSILVLLGFSVNCVAIIAIKAEFVKVLTNHRLSTSYQMLLTFFMSIFDLIWNQLIVSIAIRSLASYISVYRRVKWHSLCLFFNSLIAPLLVSAFFDHNCFVAIYSNDDSITSRGLVRYCTLYDLNNGACATYNYLELSTTYQPPFAYHYGCTSSLLSTFVPVFLFSYCIFVIIFSLAIWMMTCYQEQFITAGFHVIFPDIFFPLSTSTYEAANENDSWNKNKRSLPAPGIMSALIHHIVVMLTFGIASPPLGVVIAIAIVLVVTIWILLIGRYLTEATKAFLPNDSTGLTDKLLYESVESSEEQKERALTNLNSACREVWTVLPDSRWYVIICSIVFVCCLAFDMIGDKTGWHTALLITSISGFAMLITLIAFNKLLDQHADHSVRNSNDIESVTDLDIVRSAFTIDSESQESNPRNLNVSS